jgi:hypothetical protein
MSASLLDGAKKAGVSWGHDFAHSIAKERQAGNSSARALRISSSLYSMAARGIATTRTETLSYEVHQR